jgi:hypothetical protein
LSMHASKTLGLFFESKDQEQPVDPAKLAQYFALIAETYRPKICVLSACNTELHAQAIQPFCDYVIGTRDFFPDEAAIVFAKSFYKGILTGISPEKAFKLGTQAILEFRRSKIPSPRNSVHPAQPYLQTINPFQDEQLPQRPWLQPHGPATRGL